MMLISCRRMFYGLVSKGLSIRLVDVDMLSYKKLIPALAEFNDAYIATADDDIYYPRDWLSMLVSAVKPERREVVGLRGRWIEFEADGSFAPYRSWKFLENETPASARVLLTGVGGTLYPPNCFTAEVADVKKFLSLSPSTDDLWFYFLLRKNGYVCRKVGGWIPSEIVEGSQQQSLWAINEGGENDRAWNRLVPGVRVSMPHGSRGRGLKGRRFREKSFSEARARPRYGTPFCLARGTAGQRSVEERGGSESSAWRSIRCDDRLQASS